MKKLLFMLAACLFVLASCEPEPVLSLDKESLTFSQEGGTATVAVTANNDWTVTGANNYCSVSPSAGNKNGFITITVSENNATIGRSVSLVVSCVSRSETASKTLTIKQDGAAGKAEIVKYAVAGDLASIPAAGATVTFDIEANSQWTFTCDAADVTIDKASGVSLKTTITATVGTNPQFEGRELKFSLSCMTESGGNTASVTIPQDGGLLTYAGETYRTVKMKDGKWWMAENLRYIPAGMTPSDDVTAVKAGIWYPLVVDELTPDKASVKFSREAAVIKANGYLYNTETALGLKTGDLTVENCKNYEGVRGICPEGWHIPTRADIIALVGKTNAKEDTNPNAPYYDPDLNGGNASIALLNADGFNAGAWGAVSIANTTTAKASLMGAVKSYQGGMNTGYLAGSTLVDTGKNMTTNEDGSIKNCQFMCFMPFVGNGTYNGALNNYRNGVSVRCVKNN